MKFQQEGLRLFNIRKNHEADAISITRDDMIDEERRLSAAKAPRRRESA